MCPYTILSFETFLKTKSNSLEEKKSKTLAFRHIFIFTYSREVLFPQNSFTWPRHFYIKNNLNPKNALSTKEEGRGDDNAIMDWIQLLFITLEFVDEFLPFGLSSNLLHISLRRGWQRNTLAVVFYWSPLSQIKSKLGKCCWESIPSLD